MITVNSLSGGKTSSYMAVHYPSDYNIFSLVRIESVKCRPKDDGLVRYVSDKINMDFIATAESDKTLYVMRELEQMIGKDIVWVTGPSFDELCSKRKALPNLMQRFCTTELKMYPIANWWYREIREKICMRVGFRYDEQERKNRFRTDIKIITGKHKNGNNKWDEFNWRVGDFPLIDDKINHFHILDWSRRNTNLVFPPDSNCVGCFWKPVQQLRKNFDDEPLKMEYFSSLERRNYGGGKKPIRFKKEMGYDQISAIGLQGDFFFGTGTGCQAGFCTD